MNIKNKKFPFSASLAYTNGFILLEFKSKTKNNNYQPKIRIIIGLRDSEVQFNFKSYDYYSQLSLENDMEELKDITQEEKSSIFNLIFEG